MYLLRHIMMQDRPVLRNVGKHQPIQSSDHDDYGAEVARVDLVALVGVHGAVVDLEHAPRQNHGQLLIETACNASRAPKQRDMHHSYTQARVKCGWCSFVCVIVFVFDLLSAHTYLCQLARGDGTHPCLLGCRAPSLGAAAVEVHDDVVRPGPGGHHCGRRRSSATKSTPLCMWPAPVGMMAIHNTHSLAPRTDRSRTRRSDGRPQASRAHSPARSQSCRPADRVASQATLHVGCRGRRLRHRAGLRLFPRRNLARQSVSQPSTRGHLLR
jgi:hypothetical protein